METVGVISVAKLVMRDQLIMRGPPTGEVAPFMRTVYEDECLGFLFFSLMKDFFHPSPLQYLFFEKIYLNKTNKNLRNTLVR